MVIGDLVSTICRVKLERYGLGSGVYCGVAKGEDLVSLPFSVLV